MMNIRILTAALVCAVAPVFSIGAESSALDEQMEEINLAYRKLGRQIADSAKNADSLKQVAIIKEHAEASLKLEPKKKAELPAAEQQKFVQNYQAAMKEFIGQIDKLDAALKAGKNTEAADLLKAMKQSQETGHKEFRKKK